MTKLKRATHKPEGFTKEQMLGFSLLSHKASAIAITNRLTGSQFRLWHYLMMIDPFADQTSSGERVYHDIPSPAEIGFAIGSSPRTVEKDMDRLEKLGLYAKRISGWQGYNLTAEDGRKASEAMKLAKAERTTQLLVKQPQQKPVYDKKPPEPLQDKGGYLAGAETLTQQGQTLKPLQDKGGYLTGNPVISPQSRLNSRESGKIAEVKMAETQTGQEIQAPAISPQIIQSNLESTDNVLADEKTFGEEEEKEASQEVDDSGTLQEVEPTGILEEPLDPITQVQQATVQLLDERQIFDDLRRLGIETNETVRTVIKKHKANVPSAIAHIQQRYNNHERFKNITGAFVKACAEGAKPRPTTRTQVNPPSVEQMYQLEQAKVAGTIRDFYLAPCSSDREIVMVDTGSGVMPWWEYLVN